MQFFIAQEGIYDGVACDCFVAYCAGQEGSDEHGSGVFGEVFEVFVELVLEILCFMAKAADIFFEGFEAAGGRVF